MQNLQKMGIEQKDAILYWARDVKTEPRASNHYGKWILVKGKGQATIGLTHWEYVPACTLQEILGLLPETIKVGKTDYTLSIYPINGKWAVDYCSETGADIQSAECDHLVDAAYSRLCWCIKQGFINTRKEARP